MWEINSNSQAFTALLAIALGVFMCLFYDIVRAIRDYKRPNNIIVFVLDVLTFAIYAIVVFSFLQLYSNGQPRFYVFAFVGVGFLFCRITASYYVAKIIKHLARKASKITSVLSGSLIICVGFVEKILKDILKNAKKLLKGLKISKKTLEKQ